MRTPSRIAIPLFVLLSILLPIYAFQMRPSRPTPLAAPTATSVKPTPTRAAPTPTRTREPTPTILIKTSRPTPTRTATVAETRTPSPTPTTTPTHTPTTTPTATVAPTEAPRTAAAIISYRLRSGDTLRRIAAYAEVPLAEILKLNQLEDSDIVYGGQIIRLPPGSLLPEHWPKPTPRPLPTFTTDQPPEQSPVIYLGRDDRRWVALTFDVGYYPDTASQVAKELGKHGVKATFFVIGFTAQTHPQMVRDIVAGGHEVGNHSWSHGDMRHMTEQEIRDELQKAEKLVQQVSPQTTSKPFFRAPFGYANETVIRIVQEEGYYVVDWAIDGLDWIEGITAREVHWTVSRALRPGAIVCLHGSSTATVKAIPMILSTLKAEGYTAVTLSELLSPE